MPPIIKITIFVNLRKIQVNPVFKAHIFILILKQQLFIGMQSQISLPSNNISNSVIVNIFLTTSKFFFIDLNHTSNEDLWWVMSALNINITKKNFSRFWDAHSFSMISLFHSSEDMHAWIMITFDFSSGTLRYFN